MSEVAQKVRVPAAVSTPAVPEELRTLPPREQPTPTGARHNGPHADEPDGATIPPAPLTSSGPPPSQPAQGSRPSQPAEVHVAGYEILGELGRGGMGVVYKARQTRLNRLVALKMILAGGHAGEAELARFRTEAEAIARLQHPNIIQVYEISEHEGKPFFSLEFCSGGSLDRKLDGTPWKPRQAAKLMETLARAMHAAHEQHVVHRDLKPANILLSPLSAGGEGSGVRRVGSPKITDFGLAKKLDEEGVTGTGAMMGTPSYMSPEQAGESKTVGPATDIYSLGAMLYELLTGRPPFKAATALDTVMQVVSLEPVPPRQLQPATPRDLETICLKCLQKAQSKRYATAEALAEDLRRFQAGEPIAARPVGALERGVRWVRRNPVVAGLAAGLVLVLTTGIVASTLFALDAREQARQADAQAQETKREALEKDRQATLARVAEGQAREAKGEAEQKARAALDAEAKMREAEGAAKRDAQAARQSEYDAKLLLVQNAWEQRQVPRFLDLLEGLKPRPGRDDLRDFEWYYWNKQFQRDLLTIQGFGTSVQCVVFSPDGKRLATACLDGTVKVCDAFTAQEVLLFKADRLGVNSVAYSPDGKCLASGGKEKTVKVWDAASGQQVASCKGHTGEIRSVAFSPDGLAWPRQAGFLTPRGWSAPTSRCGMRPQGMRFSPPLVTRAV